MVKMQPIETAGAAVIDGGGRTLTPGFIDAHTHVMVKGPFEPLIYDRTQVYVGALATVNARAMLQRGFTTIGDVGGPSQGLKDVMDKGLVEGPRILPSGAYADIVIVDGNPLQDIPLLGDPEKNLKLIMNDGRICKTTL